MPDTVYVLINSAMPELVKIGRTSRRVETRMKELDSVGVPLPFVCFSAWEVADAQVAEKALHVAFGDHRLRDKREFFRISPDKPTAILRAFGKKEVTPGQDVVEDDDDQEALEKARSRRAPFSFSNVGLKPGDMLHSVFDDEISCCVHDERKVLFRGSIMSLSGSALLVANEHGFQWKAIAGPDYWKHDDVPLSDLRLRAEGADDA